MIYHKHHIIPRHLGGTDEPSNLIKLTPNQHAEAHRKLWKKYGRWQDYCAWQGLAKLSKGKEHYKLLMTQRNKASWADPKIRAKRIKGMKESLIKRKNSPTYANRKWYEIETPTKEILKVHGLKNWCEQNKLNHNTFWKRCIADKAVYLGYKAKKVD